MRIYNNNPWKPVRHTIIKEAGLAETIHEKGYAVLPLLEPELLEALQNCYRDLHEIEDERGGLFYSVYSRDFAYRKKVFEKLEALLEPVYKNIFKNYRTVLHSFVVKAAGPESEFYLHQDTTGLDEHRFSALNLWIPLDDVTEQNGCLALVEKSHHFFTPYRSISFPAPFDNIQPTVRKYLKPIPMKAGEVLVFDNRVLHNSFANLSGKTRVAVVSGLFPQEAKIMTCYKDDYKTEGKVELIEHEDDFLLTYPKFMIDCQDRPDVGKFIGFVDDPYPEIAPEEFEDLCEKYGVVPQNKVDATTQVHCNLIGEPLHKGTTPEPAAGVPEQLSIFNKIKNYFRV